MSSSSVSVNDDLPPICADLRRALVCDDLLDLRVVHLRPDMHVWNASVCDHGIYPLTA